jgi:hypothetical protein
MVEVEDDIVAAGAEIIWVLEADVQSVDGTMTSCMDFMDDAGALAGVPADKGWCVGDGQTLPVPGTFDDSPFSVFRGFDMIVVRETMEIVYTTSHGTPGGNDNPTGADVLAEVQAAVAALGTP